MHEISIKSHAKIGHRCSKFVYKLWNILHIFNRKFLSIDCLIFALHNHQSFDFVQIL